jgi:hypothetical protein
MIILLLSCGTSWLPRAASAVSIALDPASQTVNVGDSFTLTLEAAALAGAAVGAYDISISYDATRVTLVGVTFGSSLGDVGLGEQSTDVVSGAGSVSLGSVSLLDPFALAALQGDPVALFSLTFQALAPGTGLFGVAATQLSDAFAVALTIGSQTGASVDIVPEPALAWLLALGAGAVARRRCSA